MADKQVTIQEKWKDGGVTILPSKKKTSSKKGSNATKGKNKKKG